MLSQTAVYAIAVAVYIAIAVWNICITHRADRLAAEADRLRDALCDAETDCAALRDRIDGLAADLANTRDRAALAAEARYNALRDLQAANGKCGGLQAALNAAAAERDSLRALVAQLQGNADPANDAPQEQEQAADTAANPAP